MARATGAVVVACMAVLLLASDAATAGGATVEAGIGWIPVGGPGCRGTIGECMGAEEGEEEVGTRRVLATSDHVGYRALVRGNVPCSQGGASYYNCRAGAQSNPYTRGCSTITRCRTS